MRKRRRASSKVTVTFMRAKPAKQKGTGSKSYLTQTFTEQERTLIDLWMEKTPEGLTPLDWYRAWNDGYPSEEDVEIYNALHPDEPIDLEEEE
jgi:hypothetical protein